MSRILTLMIILGLCANTVISQDIENSSDHPLISRYPGSTISWYDTQAYFPYEIPVGPITDYRVIDEWQKKEGKLTRIYYTLNGEHTISEIFANYKKAFEAESFQILTSGVFPESSRSVEVGSHKWLGTAYKGRFPNSVGITLLQGSATMGGSCYIAAKIHKSSRDIYITIAGSEYKQDEIVYLIDILEVEAVKDDLILIDADAISAAIIENGKIALYGIYFDFDKSTITNKSEPALAEIAAFLRDHPTMKIYVVGHTDMTGDLEYNINLSEKRAESVCNKLVDDYSIDASRLSPQGVGPLVPVRSNNNEKGKSKNRRVELVER